MGDRAPHALLVFALLAPWCSCGSTTYDHGVPNLSRVTEGVWRSGQPVDWRYLRDVLRVDHVLKLNNEESEAPDDPPPGIVVHRVPIFPTTSVVAVVASLGLTEVVLPSTEKRAEIQRILLTARREHWVLLVHCQNGWDRTGVVSGVALVLLDGWSKEAAWQYMLRTGFHRAHLGLDWWWAGFNN